jgi:hypothetical protein
MKTMQKGSFSEVLTQASVNFGELGDVVAGVLGGCFTSTESLLGFMLVPFDKEHDSRPPIPCFGQKSKGMAMKFQAIQKYLRRV